MIVCLIKLYLELVSSATISMHDRLLHPWLYKRKKNNNNKLHKQL